MFVNYIICVKCLEIQYHKGKFKIESFLGFLNMEDSLIPANIGLKDQNFALKWVQRNIRYFGGDPAKVTLMGHSSGGTSVAHQIASKKSAGMYLALFSLFIASQLFSETLQGTGVEEALTFPKSVVL